MDSLSQVQAFPVSSASIFNQILAKLPHGAWPDENSVEVCKSQEQIWAEELPHGARPDDCFVCGSKVTAQEANTESTESPQALKEWQSPQTQGQ